MRRFFVLTSLMLASAGMAAADLSVDSNLGTLGEGSFNLTGTTVGANSNVDDYGIGFDATLGEYVYEFTLGATSLLSIVNNEGIFVGSDHDHYLLDSLSAPGRVANALSFVDEDDQFGVFDAGTYYLSVDTYGFSTEGTFDIDLLVEAFIPPTPPMATDLGVAGTAGDLIEIDSFGSDFDTELGLYDSNGNLIDNNDDSDGTLQSSVAATLGEGTYYVALGGFNTIFANGFDATGGAGGNYNLSVTGTAGDTGSIAASEIGWFSFTVVPEPGTLMLLGLAGLFTARRR